MNEDDLKKQIKFLEDKIKDLTVEIPKCLICHEPVECPVTINGYVSTPYVSTNNKNFKKCKHSINNHTCYKCIKKYLSSTGNIYTKCLANCCKVYKDSKFSFGEIGRSIDDLPEPTLWKSLGKNGVTKCRDCKEEFNSVYDLGKHIINECTFRLVKCNSCDKDIKFNLMNEHNKICFLKCKYCNLKLTNEGNDFKPHYCLKKPMFKCKCNQLLSLDEIKNNSHIQCTKINKYEGVTSIESELPNISRVISQSLHRPFPYTSITRPITDNTLTRRYSNVTNSYLNTYQRGTNSITSQTNLLRPSELVSQSFNDLIYDDLLSDPILRNLNNNDDDNDNN